MKRFQDCSRIVKMWRYRWYLLIPFEFAFKYINRMKIGIDNPDGTHSDKYEIVDTRIIWAVSKGSAQTKIRWYYTTEEVDDRMRKMFDHFDTISDKSKKDNV